MSTNEFQVGNIVMLKSGHGLSVYGGHRYHVVHIWVVTELEDTSAKIIDVWTGQSTWVNAANWEVVWVGE